MEDYKENLNLEEQEIADEVADEILTVDESENRILFLLILLFLICLIFLVASLSFAIFNTYYNGNSTNVIDVGTDIVVDQKNKDDNKNKNRDKDASASTTTDSNKGSESSTITPTKAKDKNKEKNHKKKIDKGTVLFSFSENSNYIYMTDVFPTKDEIGKQLSGDKEYFDFNISSTLKNTSGKITYEIALLPSDDNTLSSKDVRVNLTENGKDVSINKNMVNNFSDLPNSSKRSGAKVIYKKTVSKTNINEYVFRMWYSYNAKVSSQKKQFSCRVVVNAYYE